MNIVKLKLAIREEEVLKLIRVNMPTPEKQKIENDRITAREDELFHMIVIKGTYDMPIMPEKSKANERKRHVSKKEPAFFVKYNTMQHDEINAVLQGILDKHSTKKETRHDVETQHKITASIERRTQRIIVKKDQEAALQQREYYRETIRQIIIDNKNGMSSAKALSAETNKMLTEAHRRLSQAPPSGRLTPSTAAMLDNNLRLFDDNLKLFDDKMRRMVSKICDGGKNGNKMMLPANVAHRVVSECMSIADLERSMKGAMKLGG